MHVLENFNEKPFKALLNALIKPLQIDIESYLATEVFIRHFLCGYDVSTNFSEEAFPSVLDRSTIVPHWSRFRNKHGVHWGVHPLSIKPDVDFQSDIINLAARELLNKLPAGSKIDAFSDLRMEVEKAVNDISKKLQVINGLLDRDRIWDEKMKAYLFVSKVFYSRLFEVEFQSCSLWSFITLKANAYFQGREFNEERLRKLLRALEDSDLKVAATQYLEANSLCEVVYGFKKFRKVDYYLKDLAPDVIAWRNRIVNKD